VTIVRDDWGIPHVFGRTDADAVFGLAYAQAEDDFPRVETNYLAAMGHLAEAQGERDVWRDVRRRLFVDPEATKAEYAASPPWLKALMDAWADGLNLYLSTHPEVKPRVITRFEPWMALAFSEGSIGDDIESGVSLEALEAFYGGLAAARAPSAPAGDGDSEGGSNGIAIAPSNTKDGKALLLINPHTSFYFRTEAQAVSEEGLNAYGAITWGQFFLYQGFNERVGWMHTSSGVDNIDEYLETVAQKGDRFFYRYGGAERPVTTATIAVRYRTASGVATRELTVYRTHHGPVVRAEDGKWVSVAIMHRPVEALAESFLRMKARDLASFRQTMEWRANSSNNTVYADADGHIAYFHPSFIARREGRFDWTRPVDGSDPRTDWQGTHGMDDSPHVVDPRAGWIQNTNDWPYSAAGPDSPHREDFAAYMDTHGENGRGEHAVLVLKDRKDFSLDALAAAAYDSRLPVFDEILPLLFAAYDGLPKEDARRRTLAEPMETLRVWDHRWAAASVATTLAVTWGEELYRTTRGTPPRKGNAWVEAVRAEVAPERELQALEAATSRLVESFGTWKTPWGDVNRLERLTGDIENRFDDTAPSIPVAFTSAQWGSLAAFEAKQWASQPTYDAPVDPRAKRRYGVSGNSFVAVVEFGRDRVRAKAVLTGGESGHRGTRHFDDQARRFAAGDLRDVYFYRQDLAGHVEWSYRPGEP
jgi:acyl-homoserine-lactone acylase